jgi:prophage regulatory protein
VSEKAGALNIMSVLIKRFPTEGFVRVQRIIGDESKGHEPFIPVSKANWWTGVKSGKYPQPIKIGGITVWKAEDIRLFVEQQGKGVNT